MTKRQKVIKLFKFALGLLEPGDSVLLDLKIEKTRSEAKIGPENFIMVDALKALSGQMTQEQKEMIIKLIETSLDITEMKHGADFKPEHFQSAILWSLSATDPNNIISHINLENILKN